MNDVEHAPKRPSWHTAAVAAGALALVALAVFQMAARHPSGWLVGPQRGGNNDVTFGFAAFQSVPRLSLERFQEYPLWNPYAATGGPWCGNPQSAAWYPPNWVLLVVEAGPALGWLMVVHQWWCGLGVYFLCRRWRFSVPAALAGGALCLAAPYFVSLIGEGQYTQICVMAWCPWTLLAYERFRQQPWAGLPWVALTLALSILAGHIQEAYYLGLTLTALALTDAVIRWRQTGVAAAARYLGVWCCTGAATVALAAVDLAPVWNYLQQSARAGRFAVSDPTQAGAGLPNLWQLLHCTALGGPESYRGPGQYYWSNLCYFGLVPLALAAVGGVLLRRRYPVARCAALAAFTFCFAFGSGSPVFEVCATVIPGVTMFRGPGRVLFVCAVAVSVLAAAGVEWLRQAAEDGRIDRPEGGFSASRSDAATWAAAVVLLLGALAVWGSAAGPASTWEAETSATVTAASQPVLWNQGVANTLGRWQTWVWLTTTCGLLWLSTRTRRMRRLGLAGLVVLALAELGIHAHAVLRTVPPDAVRRDGPIVDFLQPRTQFDRILAQQWLLTDREAQDNGLFKANTYEPVALLPYFAAMYALNGQRDPYTLIFGFEPFDLARLHHPVADLLGIRYAVVGPTAAEPPPPWKRVRTGEVQEPVTLRGRTPRDLPFRIYENPTALPRAFVVGRVRTARPGAQQLQALKTLDPRREVVLADDALPAGPRTEFQPATIRDYRPNRVVVEVTLDRPGYLVLTDTWYPGWAAEDNGQPTAIVQANCVGRAVPLHAGRHRVVFRYRGAGLRIGMLISGMALAWLVVRAVCARHPRRSRTVYEGTLEPRIDWSGRSRGES